MRSDRFGKLNQMILDPLISETWLLCSMDCLEWVNLAPDA